MNNPQNNPIPTNNIQANQLPSCKVCGSQDETLRLSRFRYVISAVLVTYRRSFAGYWCKRHRNRYWTLATIITALLGWFGFPFGLIYTPINLFHLAKGGDQFPDKNAVLLRLMAEQKLQKGDAEGARRCLEASLQCQDDPQVSDQLRRLYAGSLSYAQSTTPNKFSSVFFPILALTVCAVIFGAAAGLLNYFVSDMVFSLFGDSISFIELIIGWIPTIALGILVIMVLWQLLNWALERMQVTQRLLAGAIAVLTAVLANYSLLTGRAFGLLIDAFRYRLPISDSVQILVILGAVITRGGALVLNDAVSSLGSFWVFYLLIAACLLLFSLLIMVTGAARTAAAYTRLESLKPATTMSGGQISNTGWMNLALMLAGILVVIMAFPQKTTVDYLVSSQHMTAASDYMKANKIPEAERELQTAIHIYPNASDVHLELGWVYLDTNQSTLAIAEFLQSIKLNKNDNSAHNGLGEIYYHQHELDKADQEYQLALRYNPKDDFTYVGEGWVNDEKGNQTEAENDFQTALKLNPQSVDSYVGLGTIYQERGNSSQSIDALKKAIEIDPQSVMANASLGEAYLNTDQIDLASTNLEKALQLDPKNSSIQISVSEAYLSQAEFDKGVAVLESAIKTEPDWSLPHSMLAFFYYELDQSDQVQQEISLAKSAKFMTDSDWAIYGRVEVLLNHFPEAEQIFQQGLQNGVHKSLFNLALADLYSSEGKFDQAFKEIDQAVAAKALPEDVNLSRGEISMDQQDYQKSLDELKQAAQINPQNDRTHSDLGLVYFQLGQNDLALKEAQQSIQFTPYNTGALRDEAFIYRATGLLDKATSSAQELIRLSPKYDLGHFILGMCYLDAGQNDQAKTELQKFMNLYWDRASARDYKTQAEQALKKLG